MNVAKQTKCSICGLDFDFEPDDFLLDEIASGRSVIFAGAGVSTEHINSAPHSLFTELAITVGRRDLPFPDLAEAFGSMPDGRFKLMKAIQDRFDYISKFRDLRRNAQRFFLELSTMPYFNTFVTTNWDTHFEDCCAAKPFVYEADLRFWNVQDRKVLKIHGTIDDYSSIIATRSDYNKCADKLRTSLVGAKLKECLATNTCIFVGYSLRDEDFLELYDFVASSLGKFSKQHYLVTPIEPTASPPAGISIIKTDGTHFLRHIKTHMCRTGRYLEDEIYDYARDELRRVREDHADLWKRVCPKKKPQMLSASCYQDGLIDAYQIVLDQRHTGRFSDLHRLQHQLHLYEDKIDSYRKKFKFLDTAYFRGYQNALLGIALSKDRGQALAPPRYYHESVGEMRKTAYYRALNRLPEANKRAFRYLSKQAAELQDGMVLQHAPWG